MRHVRRKHRGDSSVAVAAMLAEVGYRRALEVLTPMLAKGDPVGAYLVPLLEELTGASWEICPVRTVALGVWRPPAEPCAVLLGRPGFKQLRWLAVDGSLIHDPDCIRPHRLSASGKRHNWLVLRMVRRIG